MGVAVHTRKNEIIAVAECLFVLYWIVEALIQKYFVVLCYASSKHNSSLVDHCRDCKGRSPRSPHWPATSWLLCRVSLLKRFSRSVRENLSGSIECQRDYWSWISVLLPPVKRRSFVKHPQSSSDIMTNQEKQEKNSNCSVHHGHMGFFILRVCYFPVTLLLCCSLTSPAEKFQ